MNLKSTFHRKLFEAKLINSDFFDGFSIKDKSLKKKILQWIFHLKRYRKIYIPNFVNQLNNGSGNNIFTNNTHLKYIYGCNNVTIFGQSLFKNCINIFLHFFFFSIINISF